jgi:hypothetical protein
MFVDIVVVTVILLANSGRVHARNFPQSHVKLTESGFAVSPQHDADWAGNFACATIEECAFGCNDEPLCRMFDFNVEPGHCRLFQVNLLITRERLSTGRVGVLGLTSVVYRAFNLTCDMCRDDRYLFCEQDRCRCVWNTFWNGKICLPQRYAGETCDNDGQCRQNPFGLTCNALDVCSWRGHLTAT